MTRRSRGLQAILPFTTVPRSIGLGTTPRLVLPRLRTGSRPGVVPSLPAVTRRSGRHRPTFRATLTTRSIGFGAARQLLMLGKKTRRRRGVVPSLVLILRRAGGRAGRIGLH